MKAIVTETIADGFHINHIVENDDAGQTVIDLLFSGQIAEAMDVFSPTTLDASVKEAAHGNIFVVYGRGFKNGASIYGPFNDEDYAEEFAEAYRGEDHEWQIVKTHDQHVDNSDVLGEGLSLIDPMSQIDTQKFTVLGYYEDSGLSVCEHVRARNGIHAFWVAAQTMPALTMVVALPGHATEGSGDVIFPGEGIVDASTILGQPEVFGPYDASNNNAPCEPVLN